MEQINFTEAIQRSHRIREQYHELERIHHETEWTVEEDALAFLTDAGLVGRLAMSQQGHWPTGGDPVPEMEHKLGECMWWLIILAKRMDIDMNGALEKFLSSMEKRLGS